VSHSGGFSDAHMSRMTRSTAQRQERFFGQLVTQGYFERSAEAIHLPGARTPELASGCHLSYGGLEKPLQPRLGT